MDIVIVVGLVVAAATAVPVILQLRHHPRGLRILFFAEMWERFSYYGMRGLLIFYLTQHFLFDDKTAAGSYGAYTSQVYLVPVIGGFLADRYLGATRSHWGVENSLHWVLDVVFREDDSRHHAGHSGENLGLLRRLAISLLKQEKVSKASLKTKRLRCGWDDDYLAKVITSAGLEDA